MARDRVRDSRRLKAARALAGLTVQQLAQLDAVRQNGISANLIGETERQERDARPMELRVIADALEMPAGFFLDDDPFGERVRDNGMAQRLDYVAQQVDAMRSWAANTVEYRDKTAAEILRRVSQIETRVQRNADLLAALAQTGGVAAPEPAGELGRDAGAGSPSAPPEVPPQMEPGADAQRGSG